MGLIAIRMLFGFHGGGVFGVRTPIRRCSFITRLLFLSPRFTCMDHRNLETLGFTRDHFKIFLVQKEWGPHQTCESGVSGLQGTTSKLQVMNMTEQGLCRGHLLLQDELIANGLKANVQILLLTLKFQGEDMVKISHHQQMCRTRFSKISCLIGVDKTFDRSHDFILVPSCLPPLSFSLVFLVKVGLAYNFFFPG